MILSRRVLLHAGSGILLARNVLSLDPAVAQDATPTPAPKRILAVDADTGDDNNDGSQGNPFKTISRASQVIQAGDLVQIAGGNYSGEVVIATSGNADAPITFAADEGADVTLSTGGFKITADYVTVQGITVEKVTDSAEAGIFVTGGKGIILRDITAQNNAGGGVKVKPSDNPVDSMLISGGTFQGNDGSGIVAASDTNTLTNLRVENVTLTGNAGDGLQIERATQVTVSGVLTSGNGKDNARNGVWIKQLSDAHIGGVFTEGNGHDGIALRNNQNVLISRCISRGNGHHGFDSIEGCSQITYANNVSYANGKTDADKGFYVTATRGITVRNNVFFNNAGDQIAFSNEGGDVQKIVSDHNLIFRTKGSRLIRWFSHYYGDLASYQAASSLDGASLSVDPKFTDPDKDDFTPLSGSPLIDAGTKIPGVTDNFAGTAPDIGTIEYRP
jgi:hypothetical protein